MKIDPGGNGRWAWAGRLRRHDVGAHGPAREEGGHTFVELLVVIVLLGILAGGILPVAEFSHRAEKEIQLRRALRDIRNALDAYHDLCRASGNAGKPQPGAQSALLRIKIENDPGLECWPSELDVLLEGVETNVPDYEARFLRSIPRDPFVDLDEENDAYGWVLRGAQQRTGSNVGWDRSNVFDVRSASEAQALDGSYYKDW